MLPGRRCFQLAITLCPEEGFGQFWWTEGRHAGEKYVGQFAADTRAGKGSYYFANGDVFTGWSVASPVMI
jgi:hypothetical protein